LDAPYNLKIYKKGDYDTEVAYMGCRTRVISNNYDPSREVVCGRGNLSFTSVNLPRLAIKAEKNLDIFFESLDKIMQLCIEQLTARYCIQSQKKVKNFPFLMGQGVWLDSNGLGREDEIGEILKHGSISLGFIGLAECLTALIGSHHGETEEARKLGLCPPPTLSVPELYDLIFIHAVEPNLRLENPVAIVDYPAFVPCLAKEGSGGQTGGKTVERWELYVRGIELANCYSEETDAEKVRVFFESEKAVKEKNALIPHNVDDEY
jgi:hypothetical protein